jgi:heme-binding protein
VSLASVLRWLGIGGVVTILILQLVPYGRHHTNPTGRVEPRWDTLATRGLAVRACYDCHSNETVWPWYSHVAPMSWLVQRDVDEGRRALNYSEWDRGQREARESAKSVRKGEMPPWFYALPGTSASLTPAERSTLIAGLELTFGSERTGANHRQKKNDD